MRGRSLVSGPRPVCIALVALLIAAPTRGDTLVGSGVLTTDTVWDAAGSPYIVGFLRVAGTAGADGVTTLTVEPGVVVKSFGKLTIGGTGGSDPPGALVADGGASGEPILFTSDQDVPAPGDWCGVLLDFRAHDSTFLRNVRIEYGGLACESSPAQLIDRRPGGASVTLEDVTFADSSSADLKVETADLAVQDSTLDSVILRDAARVVFDGNTFLDWGDPLSMGPRAPIPRQPATGRACASSRPGARCSAPRGCVTRRRRSRWKGARSRPSKTSRSRAPPRGSRC